MSALSIRPARWISSFPSPTPRAYTKKSLVPSLPLYFFPILNPCCEPRSVMVCCICERWIVREREIVRQMQLGTASSTQSSSITLIHSFPSPSFCLMERERERESAPELGLTKRLFNLLPNESVPDHRAADVTREAVVLALHSAVLSMALGPQKPVWRLLHMCSTSVSMSKIFPFPCCMLYFGIFLIGYNLYYVE